MRWLNSNAETEGARKRSKDTHLLRNSCPESAWLPYPLADNVRQSINEEKTALGAGEKARRFELPCVSRGREHLNKGFRVSVAPC